MTGLDWVEESTNWFLNVHMSLEWWTLVYNDKDNINNVIEIGVNKSMYN